MGGARASLSLVYYLKTNSRDLVMAPMSGALLTFIQSTCFILSMRSFPKSTSIHNSLLENVQNPRFACHMLRPSKIHIAWSSIIKSFDNNF